jgi:heptosyltransferase II
MDKSLVIMPNWIGDLALALSVILRKVDNERAHVTLLAPRHLAQLCSLLCEVPVLPYDRRSRADFLETISTLRGASFHKVYILPVSFSSAWCAFRAGIQKRRGVSKEGRGLFLTEALPGSLRNVNKHLTHEYATVLETPLCNPDAWQARTYGELREKSPCKNAIVFCPGAKYGPAKRWPWFGALAGQLSGESIVLLGDDDEAETAKEIADHHPERIKNLVGKTTLVEVVSIIAGAKLVVSNDSGLMHLAGFLGTPVVAMFGSTTPVWTRPLGKKARMATIACECSPCFSRTCKYGHYDCLKKITPDAVKSLAKEFL